MKFKLAGAITAIYDLDYLRWKRAESPRRSVSVVGNNLFARLRDRAIQASQLITVFIVSRRVRNFVVPTFVAVFPLLLTGLIVRHNWTSVPYGDEWWTPGTQVVSFFRGTLRFGDLLQQHNESRKFFPSLYYLSLVAITGRWDVKDAMALMFLLACLGSALLFVLLRQTSRLSVPGSLCAWAILNFVLFCPREYENFLWGIQLEPLTPGVALIAAMVVNLSELRLRWKILINSALAIVATYSFANGMLLWILAPPVFCNQQFVEKQSRNGARWYVLYFLCSIVSVSFYFRHYVHPRQHPPFAASLADALPLLRFFFSWVGSLFVVPGADPLFVGCFFLAIFTALMAGGIGVARREGNFRRSYPWVVLAAYSLLSGAVVAVGRMHFGINTASASRYAPVVIFFYVGLAGLAASLYEFWMGASDRIGSRLIFASGFTVGLFTAGWLSSFSTELSRVGVLREERKDLAMAVKWIPAIPLNPELSLAKVPPGVITEEAIALSKYDALRPRFVSQSLASAVCHIPVDGDTLAGALESARFSGEHRLFLTGLAWLPYRNTRADCVVVGYINSDGGLIPFTVFQPTYKRERIKTQFDIKHLPLNGFAASIDPANLPVGILTLRAWAVDNRVNRAVPMGGAITLDNVPIQKN